MAKLCLLPEENQLTELILVMKEIVLKLVGTGHKVEWSLSLVLSHSYVFTAVHHLYYLFPQGEFV